MKKVNVNDLKVWNKEDMMKYWGDWGYRKGEYVLKFELGSRGEDELLGEVDIVDNCIMVKDEEDIKKYIIDSYGDDIEDEDNYDEYVCSEIEEWFDDKNVYGECVFDELSWVYVRVNIE